MSMLYTWDPAVGGDGKRVDIILTRGDADQIGPGSKEFVATVLRAWSITASPRRTNINAYRCNFYSEYWKDGGWENEWDFVWRLSAHFPSNITLKKRPLHYVGIDRVDDYSVTMEAYKHPPFAGLIVAEFAAEKAALAAAAEISSDKELRALGAPSHAPADAVFRLGGKRFQVRAEVGSGGGDVFGGAVLKRLLARLAAQGGKMHVEE